MKTFIVRGEVTVSCFARVVARNEEEALRVARERADRVLIAEQGAPGGYDWEDGFFVQEADGTATRLRIDEDNPS